MQGNFQPSLSRGKVMWLLIAAAMLAVLFATAHMQSVSAQSRFTSYAGKVVDPNQPVFDNTTGKTPATDGNQPWMVSLQLAGAPANSPFSPSDLHFCGGVLVAPDWVMTAMHCVDPNTGWAFDAIVGAYDLNDGSGEVIPVSEIYIHEDAFIPHPFGVNYMDVAMVKLAYPATMGTPIAVQQPAQEGLSTPGVMGRVTGWGLLAGLFPTSPPILHEGHQPIVDLETCLAGMDNIAGSVTADMICAGTLEQFSSSCQGDSGGPFTVPDGNGGEVLAGVVSWGANGCGMSAGEYSVYHRTSFSYDWTSAIMNGQMPATAIPVELPVLPWDQILGG